MTAPLLTAASPTNREVLPPGAGPARRLLAAAAISALLAGVAYVVFVRTGLGQRVDNAAYVGALQQLPQTRHGDASLLRRTAADSFVLGVVLLAFVGVVRRRSRLGIAAGLAAIVAVAGTDLLKNVILTRPDLTTTPGVFATNSFPSGHTAAAIACAFALVVVSPPRWRGLAAVVAGTYAWLTAAWVQTAGWHRLSDAVGAAFVAFAVVAFMGAVMAHWRPVGAVRRAGHLPAFAILAAVWLVAAALAGVHAARVLRFLGGHLDSIPLTPAIANDAYQISVNGTVVVVVSLLMILLALAGRYDLDEPPAPATKPKEAD